jgi:flagellar biosynthesis GTPase FlhF
MYDLPELHRQMLVVLGIQDPGKIIPSEKDKKPLDPISENMAILSGKPVKAFLYQDHEAHIKVHMSAMQDPKIMQLVGQSPQAGPMQAAAMAHIAEHIGFQYRKEIEKQLGVELPPPDEHLPEDIEVALSRLIADAAERLLQKDKSEVQQQQNQQQMEDPVVKAQMMDMQNKQAEVQRKTAKDQADIQLRQQQQQIEMQRIASQERIAGVNAGIKASAQKQANDQDLDISNAKIRLEAMRTSADILKGR